MIELSEEEVNHILTILKEPSETYRSDSVIEKVESLLRDSSQERSTFVMKKKTKYTELLEIIESSTGKSTPGYSGNINLSM